MDGQRLSRPDPDGAGDRLDVEHEAGLPVGGRPPDPQALALANGERVGALVLPEHVAGGVVDDVAAVVGRPLAELLAQPAGVVAVGDEADVVGVGLGRHPQAAALGLAAYLRLGGVAQGEQRVPQLVLGQHAEHVGLVLAVVLRPVQLDESRRGAVRSRA